MDENNNINSLNETSTPMMEPNTGVTSTPETEIPTSEPNMTIEERPMEPARPIDAPIETPISPITEPTSTPVMDNTPSNNNKKGNKGLVAIIIILVIILLGAAGYILYSNGVFGNKTKDSKTTEKSTNADTKKSDTTKDSSEVIKVNFDKIKEAALTSDQELGKVTVNGIDYTIKLNRYNCSVAGQRPEQCADAHSEYLNQIRLVLPDGNNAAIVYTELGVKEIAVLDSRYVYINTGEFGYSSPTMTKSHIILDSKNSFKDIALTMTEPNIASQASYSKIENGNAVPNSEVIRNIGYVDNNNIRVGYCETSKSTANAQRYYELIITFKDGNISYKESFSADNVFCSSQL